MIINTNQDEFKNDLYDIMHLYYPDLVLNEEDEVVLTHELILKDDIEENHFDLNGNKYSEQVILPKFRSELKKKRVIKRNIKLSLYKLLVNITGKTMPWGSLTGIRPTKIGYELLEDGVSPYFIKETLMKNYLVSEDKARIVANVIRNQNCIIRNEKLVDLYINIPVCPSRCSYCSFISSEYDKVKDIMPEYLDNLVKELKAVQKIVSEKAYVIRTVYIGGGTPSVLTSEQFKRIFDEINYPISEFTVECGRPDTITEEKLKTLKEAEVTRISINPQTFCQKTLKLIGRNHTTKDVLEAYKLALKYDFSVNMDFIAGLPGEKFPTFKKTIDTAIELSPDNITVHTLSLKHGSLLFNNPPDTDANVAKMVNYAYTKLTADGYKPYYLYRQKNQIEGLENIGYAKKGKVCVFNVDSMEETNSIIACGAGAISKRVFYIDNRIERLANPKFLTDYNQRIDEIIEKKFNFF